MQEVVNAYGKQAVEEYLQTDEAKEKYDNYLYYGMTFTCTLPNGARSSFTIPAPAKHAITKSPAASRRLMCLCPTVPSTLMCTRTTA